MKSKVKTLFKKVVIIWVVICILLSSLATSFANVAEVANLNTERAGNFVANFAINFYDNWSSVNLIDSEKTVSTGGNQNIVEEAKEIFTKLVYIHHNEHRINYVMSSVSPIAVATNLESLNTIDCSSFTSGVLYKYFYDNQDKYGDTYNANIFSITQATGAMVANCESGAYAQYGLEVYKRINGAIQKWDGSKFVSDSSLSAGYDFLQSGDIVILHNNSKQHTDVVISQEGDHYLSYDCGVYATNTGWWTKSSSVDECIAKVYNMWTDGAYVIRVPANNKSATKKYEKRGEVKTEYDSTRGAYDIPNEGDGTYKLSNLSWITTVYKYALNRDVSDIFKGSGDSVEINLDTFNNKNEIDSIKAETKTSKYLDVTQLMSEGKILPGDILYADKGDGTGEYLLFVGGTKILYATEDPSVFPSGALKYDYMEYYLRRIKNNLQNAEAEKTGKGIDEVVIPKYGVTQVFRIKNEVAESISENDANLFFNGKGYYSKVEYDGIPSATLYENFHPFRWIFDLILKVLEFLLNLIIYAIRMQVVSVVTLFENLLQHIILGISGDNHSAGVEGFLGPKGTSAAGERITIESIFFNRIPILDANFFNFETAGGYELSQSDNDIVYTLRKNLNILYVLMRNFSIALMLFILIGVGIKIATTTIAAKKAEYKKFLISWLYAFCVILVMHFFMYMVFVINDYFVDICSDWGEGAAQKVAEEEISNSNSREEISLYDAVRTKAYAFSWKEGVPATIVYIFLVYLLIRFSFIYYKRYLTIYLLAISSTFMGTKYAIDRLKGKKTNSMNKWFKDFAFNVLLQSLHAFIYVIFMSVALEVSEDSIGGAIIAGVILNFMLKADQIFIKIFGMDKAGTLKDVTQAESWANTVRKLMPAYTITKNAIGLTNGVLLFGDNGLLKRIAYMTTGKDNIKDANKVLEMRKYQRKAWMSRISSIPIRALGKGLGKIHNGTVSKALQGYEGRYSMLGKSLSYDTNKKLFSEIKGYQKEKRQRFTRKIGTLADLTLGTAQKIASVGVFIGDPSLGITLHANGKKTIDKHKSLNRTQRKMNRYVGTKGEAKEKMQNKKKTFNDNLDKYAKKQNLFNEEYKAKLDDIIDARNAGDTVKEDKLMTEVREMLRKRKMENAVELDELQSDYEDYSKAKHEYGNAKHERNSKNVFGKAGQKIVRGFETVTGLDTIENIVNTDINSDYETNEKVEKHKKKLNDFYIAANDEKEYRKLVDKLNEKIEELMPNASDEERKEVFDNVLNETTNLAKKGDIKSSTISSAISNVLYKSAKEKVTVDDVDSIIKKVNKSIENANKSIIKNSLDRDEIRDTISDDAKEKIKKALREKMIKDSKGKGLESKDAVAIIREVLGEKDVMPKHEVSSANDEIKALQEQILRKNIEIRTRNQVGIAKHGSDFINLNKVIKETKKKGK